MGVVVGRSVGGTVRAAFVLFARVFVGRIGMAIAGSVAARVGRSVLSLLGAGAVLTDHNCQPPKTKATMTSRASVGGRYFFMGICDLNQGNTDQRGSNVTAVSF